MASVSFFKRPPVLLALALCSVGGVVTILGRLAGGPPTQQKRVTLSRETGTKAYPAFSPDGQRIAYSARDGSKVEPFHIWVRTVAADTPRQLTSGSGNDIGPAWSPDGTKIAFQRLEEGRTAYFVTGVDGGSEQQVAAFEGSVDEAQPMPPVAWAPGGRSLVVIQVAEKQPPFLAVVPAAGGTPKRITKPTEGSEGDSSPAVSPDGQALAFVRATGPEGADIFLCDLSGAAVRRLTFDNKPIRGISWTRDSHDLVYSANRFGGGWTLLRVPAYGGTPREIGLAGRKAEEPAVALAGNRLAYIESPSVSAIWRGRLSDAQGVSEERPLIRSNGREAFPVYSSDGAKIADVSDQTGTDELWISDAEGRNRLQITHLKGPEIRNPRWSADGKSILFDTNLDQGGTDLYSIAAATGAKPKRLVRGAEAGVPSPDGRYLYYQAQGQVWRASANGGNPEPLVKESGTGSPALSADGKTVYYRFRRAIWQVSAAGGESKEAFMPDHDLFWTVLQPVKAGVYYLEFERSSRGMVVSYYDFAKKKPSVVFRMKSGNSFSVSPDARYIVYPKVDQSETNLMVLENFR